MQKFGFVILFALAFSIPDSFSQVLKPKSPVFPTPLPAKVSAPPATKNLTGLLNTPAISRIYWKSPQELGMPRGESRKVLNFEGASYSSDFLPIFFKRIPLSATANTAVAALLNPVYEALDQVSAALVSKKMLKTTILPKVVVTLERRIPSAEVSFVPLRINPYTGGIERLVSFELKVVGDKNFQKEKIVRRTSAPSSVLSSGTWYRIGVPSSGIYKMNYSFLKSLGLDMSSINKQRIQLYGNGGAMLPFQNAVFRYDDLVQDAIYVSGSSGQTKLDSADYILFYGDGPNKWTYSPSNPAGSNKFIHTLNKFSDTTFYFLTVDATTPSRRIASQPSSSLTPNLQVSAFDDYAYVENDAVNLIQSGREWYGEQFDAINTYSYPFSFPNIDTAHITVQTELVARADGDSTLFRLACQGKSVNFGTPPVNFAMYWTDYASKGTGTISMKSTTSAFNVTVTKQSPAPNLGWMNYVEVNARRQLIMSGNQMMFRDAASVGVGNTSRFTLSSATPRLRVWEVTDITNVRAQETVFAAGFNTSTFAVPTDSLRQFIAFDTTALSSFPIPVSFGMVPNQNLHGTGQVDFVIVSHPLFLQEARRLADLHSRNDNLSSVVVTPQEIYNEFSSGKQDVTAIRDFVKMIYDRSSGPADMPKYLLLFGDGSYDPKHRLPGNTNFVIAFENSDALNYSDSYVSDEFFGLLDYNEGGWDSSSDNGALDIGIGRFPVRTVQSAKDMVDKVEKYVSLGSPPAQTGCTVQGCTVMRDWRNTICFVADDGDVAQHLLQAEQLSYMVDTAVGAYHVDKIYLDAFQEEHTPFGGRYPDVEAAITRRVEKGALIFNYTGHGGTAGLSHKQVVTNTMINSWDNLCNLPFFVTATCEFAQYDNPSFVSAGEGILLNANGGGIGLLTTVRLVFSTPNFILNQNFYRCVLQPINGKMPRLGDIYRITQVLSGSVINNRNFSLLGDPALRLAYPERQAKTTVFNNTVVTSTSTDTIQGLSRVTVKGYVMDSLGNKWTAFNGSLYPTVYDKPSNLTTLSNDGSNNSPAVTFQLQKNILYKGKSSITSGDFQFSFVVPKDIAFQYGPGKISYYFENGIKDGAGAFTQFQVGGTLLNPPKDVTGPKIRLYLNDSTFQYGANTTADPRLYAILFDSSGMNVVGNGIGHDLVSVLDGNTTSPVLLNDYYTADINSYRSGKINYPYTALAEGMHTLRLKAWDVYDNYSESVTEFVVASSAPLALKHVLNYPNPFTTRTSFFFEDNECCQTLNVEIAIFTVTGKLVKTIETSFNIDGYRSPPIDWDGRDDFGDKIGRGVYVYRLSVRSPSGGTSEKLEKLVILN
jgi:hypothetical protein